MGSRSCGHSDPAADVLVRESSDTESRELLETRTVDVGLPLRRSADLARRIVLDPILRLAAAVVAASATVLISVVSLIYSKRWEQARTIQEAQREHKRGVYEEFMRFWFRTIAADSLGEEPPDEAEIMRFMATFNQKLILWGSDELLSEYVLFRSAGAVAEEDGGSPKMVFAFERLLYAIRRDLGHANKGLATGDLLRLFINDIDSVLSGSELGAETTDTT